MTRVRTLGGSALSTEDLVTSTSVDIDIDALEGLALQAVYTNATPTAKTFVDANVATGTEIITITSHGFVTGLKVALTTDGELPGGLSATDYYVIKVSDNTIKLAASYAAAIAGTAEDITSAAGGGTHTLTPATLSGAIKLQTSIDGSTFVDLADQTVSFTSTGSKIFNLVDRYERVVRVVYTHTAGAVDLAIYQNGY